MNPDAWFRINGSCFVEISVRIRPQKALPVKAQASACARPHVLQLGKASRIPVESSTAAVVGWDVSFPR